MYDLRAFALKCGFHIKWANVTVNKKVISENLNIFIGDSHSHRRHLCTATSQLLWNICNNLDTNASITVERLTVRCTYSTNDTKISTENL